MQEMAFLPMDDRDEDGGEDPRDQMSWKKDRPGAGIDEPADQEDRVDGGDDPGPEAVPARQEMVIGIGHHSKSDQKGDEGVSGEGDSGGGEEPELVGTDFDSNPEQTDDRTDEQAKLEDVDRAPSAFEFDREDGGGDRSENGDGERIRLNKVSRPKRPKMSEREVDREEEK